jgi:RNA polymerase sigma-70 factor (ECF subfamily)
VDTPLSLLARIRDETDASAWRRFDAIYRPMLTRYARLCGLADQDTEDLVQACMAAIHRSIEGFVHDGHAGRFRAWLRTMVANRVRNALERRRELAAGSAEFERPQGRELRPDDAFDRLWLNEHLRYYLGEIRSEIDEPGYQAFDLHVLQQRPVEEVCATLGLEPQQLYKIKWRITQKLRDRMGMLGE